MEAAARRNRLRRLSVFSLPRLTRYVNRIFPKTGKKLRRPRPLAFASAQKPIFPIFKKNGGVPFSLTDGDGRRREAVPEKKESKRGGKNR